MSVYVDEMNARYHGMNMSHMIADTHEELLAMVDDIGVQRKWIQKEGQYNEHFDVCMSKRKLAVQFGAKVVTWKELVLMLRNRRMYGKLLT